MTSGRRDLGTRGRVLVAAVAVGSAGVLAGWMSATDHAATSNDSTSSSPAVSGSGAGNSSGTSSQPTFGDEGSAVPGTQQSPVAVPDARTGGS